MKSTDLSLKPPSTEMEIMERNLKSSTQLNQKLNMEMTELRAKLIKATEPVPMETGEMMAMANEGNQVPDLQLQSWVYKMPMMNHQTEQTCMISYLLSRMELMRQTFLAETAQLYSEEEMQKVRSQMNLNNQTAAIQKQTIMTLEIERNTLNQCIRILASHGKIDPASETHFDESN